MSLLDAPAETPQPLALIVDDDGSSAAILKHLLKAEGFRTCVADNGARGVALFEQLQPDLVFMDVVMPGLDGYAATRQIKSASAERFVPLIFTTVLSDADAALRCIDAGGDDYLVKPYLPFVLRAKIRAMRRIAQLHAKALAQNAELVELHQLQALENDIAHQVFHKALASQNVAMQSIRSLLRPAATFNGDFMASAYSPQGDLNVLLADFTGHGLPAAIMAVPMAQAFRYLCDKGLSHHALVASLNAQAHKMLPTGIFMAAVIVRIERDLKTASIWNGGMPAAMVLHARGGVRHRVTSFHPPLGILPTLLRDARPQLVDISAGDYVLLCSDGVLEARDDGGQQFGEARYERAADQVPAAQVFDEVCAALQDFCGARVQPDDVSISAIPCQSSAVLPHVKRGPSAPPSDAPSHSLWRWRLELQGEKIARAEPVPGAIEHLSQAVNIDAHRTALFTILTELYSNALEHGVLRLDSRTKRSEESFLAYYTERAQRLRALRTGHICIDLQCRVMNGELKLVIRIEDSGDGFDYESCEDGTKGVCAHGRGISLVRSLCESVEYLGCGNWVVAVYGLHP